MDDQLCLPTRARLLGWGGTSPDALTRTAQRLGVAIASIGLVSGCMGDPPPDSEVQPLEIVIGNPDPDHGPCSLNVDEVAAGTHDVTPVALAGKAQVRILDPAGAVIFKRTIHEPRGGDGQDGLQEDPGSVRLRVGEYRVECISADGTHHTSLRVVPAGSES